ncbi:MAG: sensor domain-containing diguanylate cyclase [Woeseiaceae bacterium]|nr:sensor domain-containing diguanylate cyclase [Woeseiaceae bacterium]
MQKNQQSELDRMNARFAALSDEFKRNMSILRRSQERELSLLNAEDLAALFRQMTVGLRDSYGLETVTVVLADPDHDVRHLLVAGGTRVEDIPGLCFAESLTGIAPQYVALRRPWLGPYKASDHSLLFGDASNIHSIAMLPLKYKRELLGSINFGSADESRFTREHATDFFAHLGAIASFALENVVNRARLLRSGFTDVLTGWNNRRYLQVRLTEELARARRDGSNLVCLMLDIDHFKAVNDTYGHAAGDTVLRELANRIESQVRASDIAARYGGEEFVVLLPATEIESGKLLAERIRKAIAATAIEIGNGKEITITASIGIASIAPGRDVEDLKTAGESLLARADVALYSAKSSGRDQVAVENNGNAEPAAIARSG